MTRLTPYMQRPRNEATCRYRGAMTMLSCLKDNNFQDIIQSKCPRPDRPVMGISNIVTDKTRDEHNIRANTSGYFSVFMYFTSSLTASSARMGT